MCHSAHVEIREQLERVSSLLLSGGSFHQIQVTILDGKHLYLRSHLTSSKSSILDDMRSYISRKTCGLPQAVKGPLHFSSVPSPLVSNPPTLVCPNWQTVL